MQAELNGSEGVAALLRVTTAWTPAAIAVFDKEADVKCRICFGSTMVDRFLATALGPESAGEVLPRVEGAAVVARCSSPSLSSASSVAC